MRTISLTAQEAAALRISGYCGVIVKGGSLEGNVIKEDRLSACELDSTFNCIVRVVSAHTVLEDSTIFILVPAV